MLVPIKNFEVLRRAAEAASGARYDTAYVTLTPMDGTTAGGGDTITVTTVMPDVPKERVVLQVGSAGYSAPPPVSAAVMTCGYAGMDLLRVWAEPCPEEGFPGGFFKADAVFWSLSAVEKFAVPYYSSVFGDDGPEIARALLDSMKGSPVPPAGSTAASAEAEVPAVFAVAHLPTSEYISDQDPGAVDAAGSTLAAGTGSAVPRLFTLHVDGKARHIRIRRGG